MGRFIIRTIVIAIVTMALFVVVFFALAALAGSSKALLEIVLIPISFYFFELPFGAALWVAFFLFVVLLDQIKIR